jgi:hypothetical protein
MTEQDDDAMDAALARTLDPLAEDVAPLSSAVLTRLAKTSSPVRTPIAEVLVQPLPAASVLFGLLVLAVLLGYLGGPAVPDEITAIAELIAVGF